MKFVTNNFNFQSPMLFPGESKFYLNGIEMDSKNTASTTANTVGVNKIDIGSTNPVSDCHCSLDEIEVYSKAISAQEVVNIYDRYKMNFVNCLIG